MLSAAFASTGAARAQVLFVDRDATGAGSGASWADAVTDLQAGITAALASGARQVWVAEGSYPTTSPGGPASATFTLHDGLGLYGGFAGTETSFPQRDVAAHPTILTGDDDGDDQPNWIQHSNNSSHVVTADGVGRTAVLDGFTVRGGYASGGFGGGGFGGGLHALSGAPTVARCTFTDNYATSAGGVLVGGAEGASFVDCTFSANLSQPYRAGALYLAGGSVLVERCVFTGNVAKGFGSPSDAGALWIDSGTAATVRRCTFVGNSTTNTGVNMDNGGAICNLSDLLVLEGCTFAGNTAEVAGAFWNGGDTVTSQCVFSGNSALVGGGLVNFFNTTTVAGCTFSANSAGDGGAIVNSYSPLVRVRDCILWGNTSPGQTTLHAQIHNQFGASSEIRWSCVQGLLEVIPGEDPPDPANFPGCVDSNPLFADANGADNVPGSTDDDVRLLAGSPCIDAGNNAFVPAGLLEDAAAQPRFHDAAAPDVGAGTPPLVDMGAREQGSVSPWTDLGSSLPGSLGNPDLRGTGALVEGGPGGLGLLRSAPRAPLALLFVSIGAIPVPFKAGVLQAFPPLLAIALPVDAQGSAGLSWAAWPAGLSGTTLVFQFAVKDNAAQAGVSLSNAAAAAVP